MKPVRLFFLTFIMVFAPVLVAVAEINMTRNWNPGRGYHPFIHACREGVLLENSSDTLLYDYISLDSVGNNFSLSFRSRNFNSDPHKNYLYYNNEGEPRSIKFPQWGFFITSVADTLIVTVENKEKEGAFESFPATELKINYLKSGLSRKMLIKKNLSTYNKDNLWHIENTREGITLSAGDKSLEERERGLPSIERITGFGFFSGWGGKLLISDIKASYSSAESSYSFSNTLQMEDYFKKSKDQMEGFWTPFDRNLEENLLKFGGNYTLACFKNDEGYDFLYIDGAVVNKENWAKGDLKVRLTPTPFKGIYNVVWIDAMKKPMSFDIKAEEGEGNTLTFQFPYQDSSFRFRKPDP